MCIKAQAGIKQQFQLQGSIAQMNGRYLYLTYYSSLHKIITDSAQVTNGQFEFNGSINEPTYATLLKQNIKRWSSSDTNIASFFIEPGVLKLRFKNNAFSVPDLSGSNTEDDNKALKSLQSANNLPLSVLNKQYHELNQKYIAINDNIDSIALLNEISVKMDSINTLSIPFLKKKLTADTTFFRTHPNSIVTAFELQKHLTTLSPAIIATFYNQLSYQVTKSRYGKRLKSKIDELKNGTIGSIANNFETTTSDHRKIQLSQFRGKYVLLIFWASWCKPCRKENPSLDSMFHSLAITKANIEFIAIGDDINTEDKWRAAIKQDKIEKWQHGINSKNNNIVNLYGISLLPTKFLIDPNGIIIGRYETDENTQLFKDIKEIICNSLPQEVHTKKQSL